MSQQISKIRTIYAKLRWVSCDPVSTPRTLDLPEQVRRVTVHTRAVGHSQRLSNARQRAYANAGRRCHSPATPAGKEELPGRAMAAGGSRPPGSRDDMRGQYETPGGSDHCHYGPERARRRISDIAMAVGQRRPGRSSARPRRSAASSPGRRCWRRRPGSARSLARLGARQAFEVSERRCCGNAGRADEGRTRRPRRADRAAVGVRAGTAGGRQRSTRAGHRISARAHAAQLA